MVTLALANMYIHIGSTLVETLASYARDSWFEPNNPAFSFFIRIFLTCKQTCKLEFTGLYDKMLFDKNFTAKQVRMFYYTPYTTLRTIKHPIADYFPYILRTPPNTFRK